MCIRDRAMRFKLLGLEQLTKIKERWFREGLRARLKLFCAFLSLRGEQMCIRDRYNTKVTVCTSVWRNFVTGWLTSAGRMWYAPVVTKRATTEKRRIR